MTAEDGFLSRWSRRKRDARRPDEAPPTPADLPVEHGPGEGAGAPVSPEPQRDPNALSPEEIAALPRIEDLTDKSDLTQFLRAGVPPLLRKAALRRMWSLDPAIRDFVGEARDYSYDWNVAGGVPVSGPLLPGDDVEATLRGMFSRPYAPGREEEEGIAAQRPDAGVEMAGLGKERLGQERLVEAGPDDSPRFDEPPVDELAACPASKAARLGGDEGVATGELASAAPGSSAVSTRRHGAARPKLD